VISSRVVAVAAVVVLGLAVPAVALAIGLRVAAASRAGATRVPTSVPTTGVPEVGALFPNGATAQHDCTATVVDSPHGDVLLTAAHCVSGTGAGMVFAPGFHGGVSPYGRWRVTAAHLAPGWLRSQDADDDFAFLSLARHRVHGRLESIERVTGAYRLGSTPRSRQAITVIGYPEGSANQALACHTRVFFTHEFPSFNCRGYVGGTSGGPWLVHTASATRVVGVIGGMNEGGCVDSRSYSSPLAQDARDAYARAVDRDAPDVAPAPAGDGCS
jgi:V8-like Glu-specific endopeptidase